MQQNSTFNVKQIRNLFREITQQDLKKEEMTKLLARYLKVEGYLVFKAESEIFVKSETVKLDISKTNYLKEIFQSGKIQVIDEVEKEEKLKEPVKNKTISNLSLAFIPLLHNNKVIGILYLERNIKEQGVFTQEEAEQIQKNFTPVFLYLLQVWNPSVTSRTNMFGLIGTSKAMIEVYRQITLFAQFDEPVLILGEAGTGKELIANAIHHFSNRRENTFRPVNCSAIPEGLAESTFFGHKKGAFTDAKEDRAGMFEHAHQGTIFLDELGDLSLSMQAKLLRILEDKRIIKVGDNKSVRSDFRLVAATNKNLEEMVEKGSFREDLYYRINVLKIVVPPLQERLEDIPLIAEDKINDLCRQYDLTIESPRLSDCAIDKLKSQTWKGNIRELINTISRSVFLHTSEKPLTADDLKFDTKPYKPMDKKIVIPGPIYGDNLDEIIQFITKMIFTKQNRNQKNTCKKLGISRHYLKNILSGNSVFRKESIRQGKRKSEEDRS